MMKEKRDYFIAAYVKHADQIYRYCYFRVYSRTMAEELTQETFLKAWKYYRSEKEIKNMQAFLYQIARNLITDVYRKKSVRPGAEESLDNLIIQKGPSVEPVYDGKGIVENEILVNETIRLIESLPENHRDVLILRYVENLAPREIAMIYRTNPRNISTQIGRALKKLKYVYSERSLKNK
jgi:RNA polymerase sigma-70 factor (ECF subfamily)